MPGKEKYQDEHRIFVQGMMCQGILKEKDVYALHNKALKMCDISIPETKEDKNSLLANNIQTINTELRKIGMLIKKGQDEDSGKCFFLLVNTQSRMIGTNRELASSVQVITTTSSWQLQSLLKFLFIFEDSVELPGAGVPQADCHRDPGKRDKGDQQH